MSNTTVPEIAVTRPFDYSPGQAQYTGDRGIIIEATTGFEGGYAFSEQFPDVWVTDNGEVEVAAGCRVPATHFLAWVDALAPVILECVEAVAS